MRPPNAPPGLPHHPVPALRGPAPAYIRTGMRFTISLHCCADTLAKGGCVGGLQVGHDGDGGLPGHAFAGVVVREAKPAGSASAAGGLSARSDTEYPGDRSAPYRKRGGL